MFGSISGFPFLGPLKGSKKIQPPKNGSITTLGNLGDYSGVPFFGSFRGSGSRTAS